MIAESANLELELVALISRLRWERYFLKDYVKSLKLPTGSAAATPEEALRLVAAMRAYRGMIEGGICVREYEHYVPDTERRYLVIDGNAHASNGTVPPVVQEVASRINNPFFSVDIALRTDGTPRVIEIGDGQVSDAIGWNPESLAALLRHLC